jgi:hypothetical protein
MVEELGEWRCCGDPSASDMRWYADILAKHTYYSRDKVSPMHLDLRREHVNE